MTKKRQIGTWNRGLRICVCFLLLGFALRQAKAEDATYVYAVQISATVQTDSPQITLQWEPDPYVANSYAIYRKTKEATDWDQLTALAGSATTFTDFDVSLGSTYEYQIIKAASLGYTGYGYIYTG